MHSSRIVHINLLTCTMVIRTRTYYIIELAFLWLYGFKSSNGITDSTLVVCTHFCCYRTTSKVSFCICYCLCNRIQTCLGKVTYCSACNIIYLSSIYLINQCLKFCNTG